MAAMHVSMQFLVVIILLTKARSELLQGLGCSSTQFLCNNGECIEKTSWCDGELDCKDRSDERHCKTNYFDDEDPNLCSMDPNLFLCANGQCIPMLGKCDGLNSCADGSDEANCVFESYLEELSGITHAEDERSAYWKDYPGHESSIEESNHFRDLNYEEFSKEVESARNWLISQRDENFGWGDYTPRAVVAMYLSKTNSVWSESDELMDKQVYIQLSIALTRNQSKSLTLSELSLYINALMATCTNPRNFYGYDLITTLRERVDSAHLSGKFVSPFIYLTLCMNNLTSYSDFKSLHSIRNDKSASNKLDILSLAALASSCMIKIPEYAHPQLLRNIIKSILDNLNYSGLPRNIYQLSLVVQALTEARVDERKWGRDEAMRFILNWQNQTGSFGDILATYYVMPILSGRSLLSLSKHCIKDVQNGLTPLEILKNANSVKVNVPYSLWFGNPVEMTQRVEIQVAEGTNFIDVMRLAQDENPNFRFKLDDTKSAPFVYSIGGIPNDAERGLYWNLHVTSNYSGYDYKPQNRDIRRYFPRDGDETVFWLRST